MGVRSEEQTMKHALAFAFLSTLLMTAGCDGDKDSVKPPVDTEKPVVMITQPSESAPVAVGVVIIAARATDSGGVTRVEFFVDDTGIGTDASGVQDIFDHHWTATPGAHVLRAVAFDAAGNTGSDTVHVVCVAPDTQGPVVTIIEPQQGATLDEGTVTIRATAIDESGVTRVEFFDDAERIGEDSVAVGGIYEHGWVAETGWHLLRVVATDSSGNAGADSARVTVGVVWQGPQADPKVFCPDSSGTTIRFAVQEPCLLEVSVIIPGTSWAVRSLVDEQLSRGVHAVTWDGRDDLGQRLPDGPYSCGMSATYGGHYLIFAPSTVTLDCSIARP
jgi:hypothetical protein